MSRSLSMLRTVRRHIGVLLVFGIVASALPYVSAAAFGPMMQVVANAGMTGNLENVWNLGGPLVARDDGLLKHWPGPVPFAVLLATWGTALLLTQLMYVLSTRRSARRWKRLLRHRHSAAGPRPHADACRSDFFATVAQSVHSIQRVTSECAGVQRLLTDCLLPPLIDAVVLAVAVSYLLAISWQMTIAALVLTPVALFTLRFAGRHVQAATQTRDASPTERWAPRSSRPSAG